MTTEWAPACVDELKDALMALDVRRLEVWVRVHVVEDDRWMDYALLLTSIAAVWIRDEVEQRLGPDLFASSQFAGFALEPSTQEGSERAAQLATMFALNGDDESVVTIVTTANGAGKIDELCGYLALIAARALNRAGFPLRLGELS